MAEYIDKEALLKALLEICKEEEIKGGTSFAMARMIDKTVHFPAADVSLKARSKWQKNREFGFCKCEACGDLYPCADYVLAWNYCPNCGAHMIKK